MKELKNLEAIRELLASHPIYTYDYSDGLHINKEATNIQVYSIDLEDEPFCCLYLRIYHHICFRGSSLRKSPGKHYFSHGLNKGCRRPIL